MSAIKDPLMCHDDDALNALEFVDKTALNGLVCAEYEHIKIGFGQEDMLQVCIYLPRDEEMLSSGERVLWQVLRWMLDVGELPAHLTMREHLGPEDYARCVAAVAGRLGVAA